MICGVGPPRAAHLLRFRHSHGGTGCGSAHRCPFTVPRWQPCRYSFADTVELTGEAIGEEGYGVAGCSVVVTAGDACCSS